VSLDLSSLRTRARVVYGLLALVAIVGSTFGVITFGRVLDQRRRLADHVDPANVAAERWLGAYVDEESGVRGYVLSGEATFLQPYRVGEATARREEANVRKFLADEAALLPLVDRFDRTAERWRRGQAGPLISRTRSAGRLQVSDARLRQSRTEFDRVRGDYLRLARALDDARGDARDSLDRRTAELAAALATALGLLALGIIGTWIMLNRSILGPLGRLGDDAQRVTQGDLEHEIGRLGPREIAELATDMESMRRRILEEVAIVEAARVRLEAQAVDLARSNQELEQFAYVASHDLQEPLRKISGFCQLLERRYAGQLDERADEYIAFAVDGAKRMQRLINDLLAFSRVGRTSASFVPVDLDAVAASALATLQRPIEEAGASVEIGPLPEIPGDPSLLEALVQNLVANAIKFRGDDPPVVTLTAVRSSRGADPEGTPAAGSRRPGDEWIFTMRDNGIGIEPAYAERVFVIFQRLHTRDTYEGTGIGLSLCRKIVEFHGGRIWVEPQDDAGTTIRWTLPVTAAAHPVTPSPAIATTPATTGPSTPAGALP
jgi:signal transduction histidine kinase